MKRPAASMKKRPAAADTPARDAIGSTDVQKKPAAAETDEERLAEMQKKPAATISEGSVDMKRPSSALVAMKPAADLKRPAADLKRPAIAAASFGTPSAPTVSVSEWGGEDAMKPLPLDERAKTVWIESTRAAPLSSIDTFSAPNFTLLLKALEEEEHLTIVHEQKDYVTQWNASNPPYSWGRIRRYGEMTIAPEPSTSMVYEDAVCRAVSSPSTSALLPLVSCFAVQQSVAAACGDAWVRVVGVTKYENISFGIVQEYDGAGCVVALRGGELRPLFMLEVVLAFSDAMYRSTHEMWVAARYPSFGYRYATWEVPTKKDPDLGPCASSFHSCLQSAFSQFGYAEVGSVLVQQLERVRCGFAKGSESKLFNDAKFALVQE